MCEYLLTVCNDFFMSNSIVIVRSGGLNFLKPVAIVLFVEWVVFEAMMCGILFVMSGSSVLATI